MLTACGSTPIRVAADLPAPIDPGCGPCLVSQCPALPSLTPAEDGTASPDDLLALGPADGKVIAECQAALRECQACIIRAREAGAIR